MQFDAIVLATDHTGESDQCTHVNKTRSLFLLIMRAYMDLQVGKVHLMGV